MLFNRIKYCRNENGSLLIESLLAIIILSISLTLIIQSLTASLRASVYSADYSKAVFFVDDKMFDVLKDRVIEAPFTEDGEFVGSDEKYRYRLESSEKTADINEINLDVYWGTRTKERKISIITYLFDPSANEK